MKGTTVVQTIMKEQGITFALMAEKMGYKTPSGISDRLYNKNDMRADVLARFLEELDCELIVRSKTKGHKEWVINGKDEE